MKYILVLISIFISTLSFSQNSDSTVQEFFEVHTVAEFPSGQDSFHFFIAHNLEYPEEALENDVFGKVWLQFDIDTSGNVQNVKVIRSNLKQYKSIFSGKRFKKKKEVEVQLKSNNDYCLETCAVNLISNSPKWTPATQRGRKVKMRFRIPINYEMY